MGLGCASTAAQSTVFTFCVIAAQDVPDELPEVAAAMTTYKTTHPNYCLSLAGTATIMENLAKNEHQAWINTHQHFEEGTQPARGDNKPVIVENVSSAPLPAAGSRIRLGQGLA